MKPQLYHILLALADQSRHGSAVAREVESLTKGEIRLWPVTLYGSLAELEGQKLIEALDRKGAHPPNESERKRYFRITREGRRALETETKRLAALVGLAQRRLGARQA